MTNRELVLRFYDLVSDGDLDAAMEMVADDFVDHEPFPGIGDDRDGVRDFFALVRTAFPDVRLQPHQIVTEGDLVAVRMTLSGTHRDEFVGIPATGRRIDVEGFDLIRLRDGRAVEHWGVTDTMTMLQQLGALPAEAAAG